MPMFKNKNEKIAPFIAGFLGSFGLLGFYFLTTGLVTGSWEFPWRQFLVFKFLMGPLVLGFGLQVGLWQYLRLKKQKVGGTTVVAGGGTAGVSMIACCAHHLAEIVPILGLSALSIFVVKYQVQFLVLGVLTNLVGIFLMVRKIKKC